MPAKRKMPMRKGMHKMPGGKMMTEAEMRRKMAAKPKKRK